MTRLDTPDGLIYADFVEYVKDGKVFVDRDHGAQVWRVQSSGSIGWRPSLAQCKRVERL